MARALLMHDNDNVATAVTDLAPGDRLDLQMGKARWRVTVGESVPFGHKVALRAIPPKGKILKYGEVIGTATRAIPAGAHVHVHNLKSTRR